MNDDSDVIRYLDNITHPKIHIIGIPEGEEREKGMETIFEEIMAKNFPQMGMKRDVQVLEAQAGPNKMNPT